MRVRRLLLGLALLLVVLNACLNREAPIEVSDPNSLLLTFLPSDDATLRESQPDVNFGAAPALEVDAASRKDILLRFEVGGIGSETVESATLRLFTTDSSPSGGDFSSTDPDWSEDSVTWQSSPPAATPLGSLGPVSAGEWVEVDVSGLVSGDGPVSLRISSSSPDGADYASKENANTFAPELIVTLLDASEPALTVDPASATVTEGDPSPTTFTATLVNSSDPIVWSLDGPGSLSTTNGPSTDYTPPATGGPDTATLTASAGPLSDSAAITIDPAPPPPGQLLFVPSDDATVRADRPGENFGAAGTLEVDGNPDKEILLRFEVQGIGSASVASATVRLYVTNRSNVGGEFFEADPAAPWNEEGVTWDTAPAAVGQSLGALGIVIPGEWVEVDVSALVSGDGPVSLRVDSGSNNGADYASKEDPSGFAPELIVILANPPNASLTVDPESASVTEGDPGPTTFTATLVNSSDPITWSLDGPGTLSTTSGPSTDYTPPASGGAGSATLTATAGPLSDSAAITIEAAPSLSVDPASASVLVGDPDPTTFTATLVNSSDPIDWSLSGPGSISTASGPSTDYTPPASGGAGSATLTATAGSLSDSAAITIDVTPPPPSLSVDPESATVTEGDTSPVAFTATLVNSSDPIVWTLDGPGTLSTTSGPSTDYTPPASGGPDTATLTATAGPLSDSATITVEAAPALSVDPPSATVTEGDTNPVTFSATLVNSSDPIVWSLSGPGSLSTTSGPVTEYMPPASGGAGSATLTASAGSLSDSATITIEAAPSLAVNPPSATVTEGDTNPTTFTATLENSSDPIAWSLSGPGSLSTTSGPSTDYTPPASGGPASATLTASAGPLSDSAAITIRAAPGPGTVSFAAGGDFGGRDSRAGTVMTDLQTRDVAAFLLLGDISYGEKHPEQVWCDWVHGYLGDDYPMQLIAGNHDEDGSLEGVIGIFAQCMPDRLNSELGPGGYGVNYAFDLGPVTVIATVPDLVIGGIHYRYDPGSSERTWLVDTIRAARSEGDWVVVGMHKVCVTIGAKACEIGVPLAQLLIDEGVDLVLQAHDHTQQRSHSLAQIQNTTVPAGAVADDGSDGLYQRGVGTVFVVAGTVGRSLYTCSHTDSESGYFVTHHCAEEDPSTKGYLLIDVSESELTANYIVTVGSYSDSFTIR